MQYLIHTFKFGWPYLRRYWKRAAMGVLLGFVFGLTNASFIWASRTVVERMEPEETELVASETN